MDNSEEGKTEENGTMKEEQPSIPNDNPVAEDASPDQSAKAGNDTWVSRFLGNKKSQPKPTTNGIVVSSTVSEGLAPTTLKADEELSSTGHVENVPEHDKPVADMINNPSFASPEMLLAQHGELTTIPEGQEDEEQPKESDDGKDSSIDTATSDVSEDKEKPKKKGFGFFLSKFRAVSTAVEPTDQSKSLPEEDAIVATSPQMNEDTEPQDIEGSVGIDEATTSNPIQQYVFGWDEQSVNKNNDSAPINEQNQFQDKPAVTVPVA